MSPATSSNTQDSVQLHVLRKTEQAMYYPFVQRMDISKSNWSIHNTHHQMIINCINPYAAYAVHCSVMPVCYSSFWLQAVCSSSPSGISSTEPSNTKSTLPAERLLGKVWSRLQSMNALQMTPPKQHTHKSKCEKNNSS